MCIGAWLPGDARLASRLGAAERDRSCEPDASPPLRAARLGSSSGAPIVCRTPSDAFVAGVATSSRSAAAAKCALARVAWPAPTSAAAVVGPRETRASWRASFRVSVPMPFALIVRSSLPASSGALSPAGTSTATLRFAYNPCPCYRTNQQPKWDRSCMPAALLLLVPCAAEIVEPKTALRPHFPVSSGPSVVP